VTRQNYLDALPSRNCYTHKLKDSQTQELLLLKTAFLGSRLGGMWEESGRRRGFFGGNEESRKTNTNNNFTFDLIKFKK